MIVDVHHIAIIVSSKRSLDFYCMLGFAETFRKTRERDTIVLMSGYGMELEFFVDPNHKKNESDEPIGLRHFALNIDGFLEDEIRRLRSISDVDLDCGPIMEDWTGNRFCFIKDYDGIMVELRERINT